MSCLFTKTRGLHNIVNYFDRYCNCNLKSHDQQRKKTCNKFTSPCLRCSDNSIISQKSVMSPADETVMLLLSSQPSLQSRHSDQVHTLRKKCAFNNVMASGQVTNNAGSCRTLCSDFVCVLQHVCKNLGEDLVLHPCLLNQRAASPHVTSWRREANNTSSLLTVCYLRLLVTPENKMLASSRSTLKYFSGTCTTCFA